MVVNDQRDETKGKEYLEIARLLLEQGADVNKNGMAGLHFDPETPLEAARRLRNLNELEPALGIQKEGNIEMGQLVTSRKQAPNQSARFSIFCL